MQKLGSNQSKLHCIKVHVCCEVETKKKRLLQDGRIGIGLRNLHVAKKEA